MTARGSVRRSKQELPADRDLLWRNRLPSGRFLLLFTSGDADARRQHLRNQFAHEALELLIYRNTSGEIAHFSFREVRYRGTLAAFVARVLSAHSKQSATAGAARQARRAS